MATAKRGRPKGKAKPQKESQAEGKKNDKDNPEVTEWLQRIDRAKKVKKDWRDKFRVTMAYDYRDGAQRPANVREDEWYTINKIYAALVAELAALYKMNPYYYVRVKKSYTPNPMDIALMEKKGRVRQNMLNYSSAEAALKDKARLSILDSYFQYGALKTHYFADTEDNPDKGQPIVDEATGSIYLDEDTGTPLEQPDKLIVHEEYKISRVHPDDFLFDADAGPLEDDWNYLFQRIVRPLDEAQQDETYDAEARRELKATELSEDDVQRERQQRKKGGAFSNDDDMQATHTVIWEVYDLRKKQWCVVADGCGKYLRVPGPLPKGIERHPFSVLRFAPLRDDSPYPIPPVSQWLDPQKETNVVRSRYMVHGQRFNRKYEVYMPALGEDGDGELAKLESGEDGTIIRKQQPVQAVWPIQDAPLDQSNMTREAIIARDFSEVATGANQRGFGAGVESATEAGIIERRISEREGTRMGAIIDFVSEIGRKMDQVIQANITRDLAVKVSGPEGELWELIKTDDYEDIDGEYEYSVSVGSLMPQVPEVERAQWISFLQLLANAPQLGTSPALIKSMADMHNIDNPVMIGELIGIFQRMMGGGMPGPRPQGSLPGVPSAATRAASVQGGMARGGKNNMGPQGQRGGKQMM